MAPVDPVNPAGPLAPVSPVGPMGPNNGVLIICWQQCVVVLAFICLVDLISV